MKQVMYEGRLIEVEDWATHISRDDDGDVWQYDAQPIIVGDEWRSVSGRFAAVNTGLPDWKDSLMEIKE